MDGTVRKQLTDKKTAEGKEHGQRKGQKGQGFRMIQCDSAPFPVVWAPAGMQTFRNTRVILYTILAGKHAFSALRTGQICIILVKEEKTEDDQSASCFPVRVFSAGAGKRPVCSVTCAQKNGRCPCRMRPSGFHRISMPVQISPFSDSSPAFPQSTSAAHWRQSRHTLRRRRRICRAGCTWDRSSPGPAPFSRCC